MPATVLSLLLMVSGVAEIERDVVALTETAVVRFATADEGREILRADDVFTASLSRFDFQCRMKTDKEVTLADWKQFVGGQVQAWDKAEMETISRSLARISKRLDKYRLPLPPIIRLVRTTGEAEKGAAYTRGTAVVLPTKVMKYPDGQ